MSLRDIADRIASISGWGKPNDIDGVTTWYFYAEVPESDRPSDIGLMQLTDEALTITAHGQYELMSTDRRASGNYSLPGSRYYRDKNRIFDDFFLVIFHANDRIETRGTPTRLAVHWLAHALQD